MKQYDAIIIGFGKGGKLLAAELANRNWKVAIIERSSQMYGGTCVNAGCIPTKTLIHESEQAEWLYRDNYDSQAKFYTSVKVAHDKKEILLQGKEIFINTGSTPILPDVEGLNESKHAFTSETLLRQSVLPKHLLILGAGTIGMEFATMYAGFGSKVTLLESGNRFMPKSDRDIAESMLEALKRKGIEVRLNVHALSMYDTANGMTLTYTDNSDGTPYFLEGDALLLATGRRAMTDGLNLHAAGVQTDAQGAIVVNGHLQTTSPHIWAMGDVRGGAMYDYLSIDDFRIITNHLFGNKKRNMDDRLPVPYVIFTDPPLAHIGTTEEEAVKRGYSIQVSRLPAAAIPRARTLQHIDGMLKVIVNAHTGRIMGCTLFCVDYSVLRDFIFTHPSMSEGLNDLFKAF